MVRLLVSLALCTVPLTGEWETKSGVVVEKPCPRLIEMLDRARLPQGCVAHQAGVWLSRDYYTQLELKNVKLKQDVETARKTAEILQKRVNDLETQLRITTVDGVCPACSCTGTALTSAAITTGVCAAWTLYQSQR